MSGGTWGYIQRNFGDVIDDIQRRIDMNGKSKSVEELAEESWRTSDWYERYPEDLYHYKYPDEVIDELKTAVDILSKAQIYLVRADKLFAGDDSDESFLERLHEDLLKYNSNALKASIRAIVEERKLQDERNKS